MSQASVVVQCINSLYSVYTLALLNLCTVQANSFTAKISCLRKQHLNTTFHRIAAVRATVRISQTVLHSLSPTFSNSCCNQCQCQSHSQIINEWNFQTRPQAIL